jgi:hypothetical protein
VDVPPVVDVPPACAVPERELEPPAPQPAISAAAITPR